MNKKSSGELELRVMQVFENFESACVEDVRKELQSTLAYTTVQTIVTRLFDKGLLAREKVGRKYYYQLQKAKARSKMTELLRRQFFRPSQVISYFLEDLEALSQEELGEIERLILEAKKRK